MMAPAFRPTRRRCCSIAASAPIRRLVPARDDAQPLYVQEQGARVGLDGDVLEVRSREAGVIGTATTSFG